MSSRLEFDADALHALSQQLDSVRDLLASSGASGLQTHAHREVLDALGEFDDDWRALTGTLVEGLTGLAQGVVKTAREFLEVDARLSHVLRTLGV